MIYAFDRKGWKRGTPRRMARRKMTSPETLAEALSRAYRADPLGGLRNRMYSGALQRITWGDCVVCTCAEDALIANVATALEVLQGLRMEGERKAA